MYDAVLYVDGHGKSPVQEFISSLEQLPIKDSRIQLRQLQVCMNVLIEHGTRAGEEYTKHISGDIWELRPGNNRILFFAWRENTFVLLHSFRKTTTKTPKREIAKAQRELEDWLERHGHQ